MQPNYDVEMRLNVKVPMRDRVNLSADIYLPKAHERLPTVLIRTPYSNNADVLIEKGRRLANNGYVCVIQDCRGRWDSDGEYYPFRDDGKDGCDTQEWAGRQEWSNGKIGMAGGSYVGWVQWASAPHRSEFLTCLAPRVICCDFFSGLVYPGGVFQLNVLMTWGMRTNGRTAQSIEYHNWTEAFRYLPLIEMDELAGRNLPFWKDWVRHPTYDDYWASMNVEERWGDIAVPALNMGGWYDLYAPQTFINFNGLRRHGRTPEARQSRLIVGPWPHALSTSARTGDIDFGASSMVDMEALELRWFDYWLKGIDNGIVNEPPLRLFVMGVNEWRDEHEWPLARTAWQKWYLHSNGCANSLRGDGSLSPALPGSDTPDTFIYDPRYPAQTMGGNNCCSPHIVPWGPYDQRPVEMRGDVLCYTSEPLAEDVEVTGPVKVVLYTVTDVPDTDWTAKFVDVSPTGYAMNLCDGIIRARYRESMTHPTLLESNRVYEYEIDLGVTGNVFRRGHCIRVEISSSNFPRFDRNPNTGHDPGLDAEMRPAHQTVYHSREYPSHILLPVIPKT
ncbi:MAG: CocE/NonD family hydrolase [Candidatus Latescibacteria bacterium]|nr:CocE/NonD family hydrolase [Candidatus Latescibacterota bacterium]